MSNEAIAIADMQCRVFRMAQKKWQMMPDECSKLFQEYELLKYIDECYGILHVSSYECVVRDLEEIVQNEGGKV